MHVCYKRKNAGEEGQEIESLDWFLMYDSGLLNVFVLMCSFMTRVSTLVTRVSTLVTRVSTLVTRVSTLVTRVSTLNMCSFLWLILLAHVTARTCIHVFEENSLDHQKVKVSMDTCEHVHIPAQAAHIGTRVRLPAHIHAACTYICRQQIWNKIWSSVKKIWNRKSKNWKRKKKKRRNAKERRTSLRLGAMCVYICMYVYVCIYVCIYVCMYACMSVCLYSVCMFI